MNDRAAGALGCYPLRRVRRGISWNKDGESSSDEGRIRGREGMGREFNDDEEGKRRGARVQATGKEEGAEK